MFWVDQRFPPGAEISGLKAKLETGPYEVKLDIKSVLRAELSNGWTAMLTFNVSSGCFATYSTNLLPASPDNPTVGNPALTCMLVNAPAWLLTITKPAAPASCANFCLSVKARVPRLTMAILPLTSDVYWFAEPRPNCPFLSLTT